MENATFGASSGLAETPVVDFSTDEAQNRWVVTHEALYLLRPGESRFHRFDSRDGLHLQGNPVRYCDDWAPDHACPIYGGAVDPGITAVAGGTANEVFVGYAGNTSGSQEFDDPNRHSGKLDRARLRADGSLQVERIDLVAGTSAQFWHDRTVERLLYDHGRHELYVGTNHGVTRILPDRIRAPRPGEWFNNVNKEFMGDHLHPRVCLHTSCTGKENHDTQLMGEWRGLALAPDGDLWVAGKWTAGKIRWTADVVGWYDRPGSQAFAVSFGDPYPQAPTADGFVNEPVFPAPREGDPVSLSAVSVGSDGRVWFASDPRSDSMPAYGVAYWDGRAFHALDAGVAGMRVRDLVALPDGRIALAGSRGLVLYDPAQRNSIVVQPPLAPPGEVLRLELDGQVAPFTLHVSTSGGAAALRRLP